MATIAEELSSLVAQLPPREQERVLSFARELAHPHAFPHSPLPPGSPPDSLLRIQLDPEVGEAMEQALADCERIDADE
ncbi:MAG TPA: hypothetical protein VKT52_08645 [Ktedonobacterales bacterium]|nr:hypothetical protein [Ktedonobacterales bacterium]